MNRRNKEKQAGFSLVEVVVSTAILFSVAGAFLAMTAANGKLLAREHSLVQGAYELSALAQKGEGSPTGEKFEVIFQGNEGDALEVFLNEKGIGTNKHYPIPVHLQKCYQDLGYKKGDFPIAERLSEEELSLPMFYGMTEEEIQYVIDAVNAFR